MVQAAVERYGRLDILDNNVGISVRADVLEVTEEQWDRVMAVNVKSIMLTSKYAIPQMIRGGGGSIINISSIAGLRANQSTPYSTFQGGCGRHDALDGGRPRPAGHPRQLHRAGAGVRPDGGAESFAG